MANHVEHPPSDAAVVELLEEIREEIREEIADLEEYARRGEGPPHCRAYRFKANGEPFTWEHRFISGRQVLETAGLTPPDHYTLRIKRAGQPPTKVALDHRIDLREPGIEKFKALPRDQTEG